MLPIGMEIFGPLADIDLSIQKGPLQKLVALQWSS
jgi:hypothetical protein